LHKGFQSYGGFIIGVVPTNFSEPLVAELYVGHKVLLTQNGTDLLYHHVMLAGVATLHAAGGEKVRCFVPHAFQR